jgi:winged helix DNA-binding protein
MPERILTLRELNRALLARQMLLERETLSVPAAVERLIGLQAQLAQPPYVGLWTRLQEFQRDDLASLIENHTVIKTTFMRATLHLSTAADYARFRATLQPALSSGWSSITKKRNPKFDMDTLLKAARAFIAEKPRTFAEITTMLSEWMPDEDVGSMRYAVRTHLPLVQMPIATGWSYPGNPKFTLAESWIDPPLENDDHFRELALRYLAAFGPAGVTDMQTWSGLQKLKAAFGKLKPDLVVYRDENRRELFDLPDMLIPDADTPTPARFLPEFDNILLSHSSRTRIIADDHRSKVYLPGLRVAATFLLDGFVAGVWKTEMKKDVATLTVEPFAPLAKTDRAVLEVEAEKLVRFAEPDAKTHEVQFNESD